MRFGIDIDGVVANFVAAFVEIANKVHPGSVDVTFEPCDWNFSNWPLSRADYDKTWRVALNQPNWWMTFKPYLDNVRAVSYHRLRYPEDEIYYVTARGRTAGMPPMHQSQEWLSSCGISGLGTAVIVDEGRDKVPIFNSLDCDANIDDKLEAVIRHNEYTKGAYLIDRLWNRKDRPSDIRVVSNLAEFFRRVRKGANA